MPGKSPAKITFSELLKRIQEGPLESKELQSVFRTRASREGMKLDVTINKRLVDISGVERTANAAARELLTEADKTLQASKLELPSGGFKIVAEGDSWFHLPSFCPDTLINGLQDMARSIDSKARFGATLMDMVEEGEHIKAIKSPKVRVLLFSAGGNDVLGGSNFQPFIKLFNVSHQDPAKVGYYIKPQYRKSMRVLINDIGDVAKSVRAQNPKVEMFIHGYDYVIPRVNGPWLGEPFKVRGFDQAQKKKRVLAQAIICKMVDIYNEMLSDLADQTSNLTYVDLRGTVGVRSNWRDELHTKTPGAKRLAKKMDKALTDQGFTAEVF